jgi:hypothetical protein
VWHSVCWPAELGGIEGWQEGLGREDVRRAGIAKTDLARAYGTSRKTVHQYLRQG